MLKHGKTRYREKVWKGYTFSISSNKRVFIFREMSARDVPCKVQGIVLWVYPVELVLCESHFTEAKDKF